MSEKVRQSCNQTLPIKDVILETVFHIAAAPYVPSKGTLVKLGTKSHLQWDASVCSLKSVTEYGGLTIEK